MRRELKAALAFLEKLTLRPDELTTVDVDEARAAGISAQGLRDAATVCALFSMIVRLADSLGWDLPERDVLRQRAPRMLDEGYALGAILKRI